LNANGNVDNRKQKLTNGDKTQENGADTSMTDAERLADGTFGGGGSIGRMDRGRSG
jgi:hypothetical protein